MAMPLWARSCTVLMAFIVSGCAQWPSTEHQAVTLESIRNLINDHEENIEKVSKAQLEKLECNQIGDVNLQLDQQSQQLASINKQLVVLSAANPSFSNVSCPAATPAAQYDGRIIVGALEWVYLPIATHHYQARIDSGATTSSMHADNILRFERDGKKWVRFELREDEDSEPIEVETPLTRTALIRQASAEETERRFVVTLTVNLGPLQQDIEFTLTNRAKMTYPVLLGRNFLQDVTLIDVGRNMVQPKFLPEVTATQTMKSTVKPEAEKPVAKQPEAKQPEAKQPEAKQPEAKQPEAKQPEAKQPEAKQPEAKQSEAKQPEAKQTEAKQPEAKQPEAKQPEAKQPEAKQPEAKQPEAEKPVAKQPEAKQPEAKQPEAKQSEAKQSEAKQSEAKQPEAKQPEAKQPEAKQPEAEKPVAKQPEAKQPEAKQPEAKQPEAKQPEAKQT